MAKYRAWAMVVRQRGAGSHGKPLGNMFVAEHSIAALVRADDKRFRVCMSVFGNFDLIVPIEAEHLKDIQDAVNCITAGGAFSTPEPTSLCQRVMPFQPGRRARGSSASASAPSRAGMSTSLCRGSCSKGVPSWQTSCSATST